MQSNTAHLSILALTWLLYGLLHSLLASLGVKRWVTKCWPTVTPWYRLLYNFLAVVLLLPPLALTLAWRGTPLWEWRGIWEWVAESAALAVVFGFLWTLRYYDGREFLGLRQRRQGEQGIEDQECFRLSPLHRYVRHPWYSLSLVIIWTRDMDPALLVTGIGMTVYFVIGSRLEERKLLFYHGDVYRQYREQVPGLIPCPWMRLSKKAAAELMVSAERRRSIV